MNKISICIGVEKFPDKPESIKGPVNDAQIWHNLLVNDFGFNKQQSKLFKDGEATKKLIINELGLMLSKLTKANDIGVFFFSGHGGTIANVMNDDELSDGVFKTGDNKLIVDDEIRSLIKENEPTGKVVFIFDCCSAASMLDFTDKITEKNKEDFQVKDFKDIRSFNNSNLLLFSASEEDEYAKSFKKGDKHYGIFSYSAVHFIKSKKDINYEYLSKEVAAIVKAKNPNQTVGLRGVEQMKKRIIF